MSVFCEHICHDPNSGRLQIGGQDVEDAIVKPYGTPLYAYSLDHCINNYRVIRDAYAQHHNKVTIHFSLKANANATLVQALIREGCGIDCVSAGEVYKALAFGCPPEHIVFAGVGKTREELLFAVEHGVGWFNVENEAELEHLNDIAQSPTVSHDIRVALRLNPDITANTHPNIATGHGGAKFGLPVDVVQRILSHPDSFPHIKFEGLHVHIGSQLGDTIQTKRAVEVALSIVSPFPSIRTLNIGGGMPVSYDGTVMPSPSEFAAAVCPLLNDYSLMLEPGRSIVANSGVLVTKVLYRKDQAGQKMLIVDASMTELMRPALYQAKHAVVPLVAARDEEEEEVFTIVGPVCETTDVLARNVTLPSRCGRPGQILALMTTGAYGFAMANNYNARPLPPQIVVSNGEVIVSTKRQSYADLVRDELTLLHKN